MLDEPLRVKRCQFVWNLRHCGRIDQYWWFSALWCDNQHRCLITFTHRSFRDNQIITILSRGNWHCDKDHLRLLRHSQSLCDVATSPLTQAFSSLQDLTWDASLSSQRAHVLNQRWERCRHNDDDWCCKKCCTLWFCDLHNSATPSTATIDCFIDQCVLQWTDEFPFFLKQSHNIQCLRQCLLSPTLWVTGCGEGMGGFLRFWRFLHSRQGTLANLNLTDPRG